ncbi:MAG: hypothetical protein ABI249_09350, partial [Ornithinibacter sp.]
ANLTWPVVALLHVAHVVTLRREAMAQRRLADRAAVWLPAASVRQAGTPRSAAAPPGLMHLASVGLLVAALGCLGMLMRAQSADAAHTARSIVVSSRVVGFTDDGLVQARPDSPVAGLPDVVVLDPLDPYDVGDEVILRADPTDPGWTHPAGEPPDPTWWASLALGAALLSGLLAERLLTARMRRAVFLARPPTRGVPIRYAVDDGSCAVLACVEGEAVFAELQVIPAADLPQAGPLAESLRPAYLVGDVRTGGWCAVATADGMLLPESPLSAWPDLPLSSQVEEESGGDPREWSSPVPESALPAALPVRLGPTVLDRVLGVAAAVGATAFGVWLLDPEVGGWFSSLLILAGVMNVAYWGVNRAVESVTVDRSGLSVASALRRSTVAMMSVEEVRCTPTHVLVLGAEGQELEIGPFGAGEPGRHSVVSRGRPAMGPSAAQVASAIDHARVAASSVDATRTGEGGARWRPGTGVPWLALVAAVVLVRYLQVFVL